MGKDINRPLLGIVIPINTISIYYMEVTSLVCPFSEKKTVGKKTEKMFKVLDKFFSISI